MALPLWVVAKISLKVGCTYASKLASKSLLGPLGKAVLSSPVPLPPVCRQFIFMLFNLELSLESNKCRLWERCLGA